MKRSHYSLGAVLTAWVNCLLERIRRAKMYNYPLLTLNEYGIPSCPCNSKAGVYSPGVQGEPNHHSRTYSPLVKHTHKRSAYHQIRSSQPYTQCLRTESSVGYVQASNSHVGCLSANGVSAHKAALFSDIQRALSLENLVHRKSERSRVLKLTHIRKDLILFHLFKLDIFRQSN